MYIIPSFFSIKKGFNSKSRLKNMGLNKDQCLTPNVPPFIPGNIILLNEVNDDNPETIDTSQSEKDYTSHNSRDDSIEKVKDTKNTNNDDK